MSAITPISRGEGLAYIDLFHKERDLAIESPSHYLVFDEALSPVLQAVTLDQLLERHPTDASYSERVRSCFDIVDFVRTRLKIRQKESAPADLFCGTGIMKPEAPTFNPEKHREAGQSNLSTRSIGLLRTHLNSEQ